MLGNLVTEGRLVRRGEIVDGAHDSRAARAGAGQIAGLVDTRGDEHGIMFLAQLGKADVLADVAVHHELHTALFKLFVAAHDDVFFQLEAGNAVGQQPAGAVVAVIDGDLHTCAAQTVGGGKAAGAGADDADALAALGGWLDVLDPAFFKRRVGDVFLDRTDGDGAVARLLDHAVAFAQTILRADATADFREGVGRLRNLVGFLEPPGRGHAQPVGDIVVKRAVALTVRHTALAAPRRLLGCLRIRELCINLVKVFTT